MKKQPDKGRSNASEEQLSFGSLKVHQTIKDEIPGLYEFLTNRPAELISVRISYRGENDFLAIGKRFSGDGTVQVVFGSGPDFASCLLGLEAAMEQDKWRADKWLK